MTLTITLNLPPELEQKLRGQSQDLNAEVREAYPVDVFRQGKLTHAELAQVLGVDRVEVDAILKRHKVVEGSLTFDDIEADRQTLDRVLNNAS